MPGRIILIPGLFHSDEVFLDRFARGGRADYALLATRSLLERWQAELLRRLPGHALWGQRLVLFTGLSRSILGPSAPNAASNVCRQTVMALTLSRLFGEGMLDVWAPIATSPALADEVLASLGELQRGLVPRVALDDLMGEDARMNALARVWREYETALAALGRAEPSWMLAMARAVISGQGRSCFEFDSLVVHGFLDFSPLQADLLRYLAQGAGTVTILLPSPHGCGPRGMAGQAVPEQFPGWENEAWTGAAPAATRLGRLAVGREDPGPPDASVIQLIGEGEGALASLIARTVRARLNADPTLRLEDIALVRREVDPGSSFVASLRRHGLEVCDETGPSLLSLNSVGTLLAALDCLSRDWPRASVLRLARGVFVKAEAVLADAMAQASSRSGVVRTRAAWGMPAAAPEDSIPDEARPLMDKQLALAGAAVERLEQGLALLPAVTGTSGYSRALRTLVAAWRLPQNWWPAAVEQTALSAYALEMQGLERLLATLEEIASVESALGRERTWNPGSLGVLLGRMAAEICLPVPAGAGSIHCLSPAEIRGLRFRLVFLVGLAEGEFPKPIGEDWLLPEEKRQRLIGPDYGLEPRPVLAAREWHLLANVLAAAEECLYLCWSTRDDQGEVVAPSVFLTHLQERLAPLPTEYLRAAESLPRDPEEAWDWASAMGRLLADLLWEELPDGRVPAALAAYEERRQEVSGLLARSVVSMPCPADEGPGTGLAGAPDIAASLDQRFGSHQIMGASALEDYAVCPFLFFARRILMLEAIEAPEEEPSGLDLGQAYHSALEKFSRRVGQAPLTSANLQRYERDLADAVVDAFAPLSIAARTQVAGRLVAMGQRVCLDRLTALVRAEVRLTKTAGPWRIAHAELGFGLRTGEGLDPFSVTEPLTISRDDSTIRIAGKIDRVDLLPGGYYAIYDYKLGRVPEPGKIISGRSLQIPVYLLAAMRIFFPSLTAAGGGYYSLRERSRQAGLWRRELAHLTGISARAGGSLSEPDWECTLAALTERILAVAEGIRAGRFRPTEESCPPYCAMRPVCRKEER